MNHISFKSVIELYFLSDYFLSLNVLLLWALTMRNILSLSLEIID